MSDVSPVDKGKRALMALGTLGIGAVIGGPMAYAAFQFAVVNAVKPGGKGEGGEKKWIELGNLSEFPEGTPTQKKISIDTIDGWVKSSSDEAIWVVRQGDKVLTFTATCPHLGCKVNWVPDQSQYFCPCHNSYFEKTGNKKPGSAAARGLDALENQITNGKIEVIFKRYKGVSDKKEEFA
jgi:menaquinol-cytochrome c reductase iron-sulfur subunit